MKYLVTIVMVLLMFNFFAFGEADSNPDQSVTTLNTATARPISTKDTPREVTDANYAKAQTGTDVKPGKKNATGKRFDCDTTGGGGCNPASEPRLVSPMGANGKVIKDPKRPKNDTGNADKTPKATQ